MKDQEKQEGKLGFTRDTYQHSSVTKVTIRKVVLFVNPVSGKGQAKKVADDVITIFHEAGIETVLEETKRARHIIELVRGYDVSGVDAFVVLGGDGTVHEA
jgi:diacylglycerol kinase family enzyme